MRPKSRFALICSLAFFSGIASAAGAYAVDNIMKTANYQVDCSYASVCQTDNVDVYYVSLNTISQSSLNNVVVPTAQKYDQATNLNVSYDQTPNYSGENETDWVYTQGTVAGSDVAYAYCDDVVNGSALRCDQHYLTFEPGYLVLAIACHESGHGAGLTHGENAAPALSNSDESLRCMKKPTSGSDTLIGSNNVSNINSVYP